LTEKLEPQFLLEPPEFAGHPDPHVWMDVKAWRQAVDVVATALSDFDPARAHAYRAHAATYGAKLDALDDYVRKVIASIPKERRVLVTAHDAFNYFGRAYDMEVVGIQGISTESEAGLRDINERIELILSRGVPAVFVETSVSDKNVRALVEGVAARGGVLKIGGSLFSDAMGAPGSYEGTYIGMIDHNATVIARALGGDAPPRGMNGELADTD
jgi:manganese/zinc/iron transport system substrate-binding protein